MTDLVFKAQLDPAALVIRIVPPFNAHPAAFHRRLDLVATVMEGALSQPHETNPFLGKHNCGPQADAWAFGRGTQ